MIVEKFKQCDIVATGVSHVQNNTKCQDYTFHKTSNGVMAIALADGAGSKQHSQLGAKIVTETICDLLTENFYEYLVLCEKRGIDDKLQRNNFTILKKQILDTLQAQLSRFAVSNNVDYSELSSTLLFYAYKDGYYIQGHIGDGAIGILKNSGDSNQIYVASRPENGGQANITYFVTSPDAIDHLRIEGGIIDQLYGVILMSDGPSELLYNDVTGFIDNTAKIFHNFHRKKPNEYKETLSDFMANVVAKYSDDDLSFNILYRETLSNNAVILTDYLNYFFSEIYSNEQIIVLSKYGYLLKPEEQYKKRVFKDAYEVRKYLEWD